MFAVTNQRGPREPTTCWRPPLPPWRPRASSPRLHRLAEHPRGRPGEDERTTRSTRGRPRRERESLAAIRYLERVVPAAVPMQGIVLRYGSFYGPGASETLVGLVRKRRLPIIGDGAGILVVPAHPRRGRGDGRGAGTRPGGRLQRGGRRAGPGRAMAAVPGAGGRREPAPPDTGMARAARRRGGGGGRDDPDPRLVERPGEAGARLAARMAELAAGLFGRACRRRASARRRITGRAEDDHGRDLSAAPAAGCSRSPIA